MNNQLSLKLFNSDSQMKEDHQVKLGEIFEIARGGSPRPIQKFLTEDPNGINWIMIADAPEDSKYITRTKKKIIQSGIKSSRMVYPGDFLLTNSMSFGRPYLMKATGCIHDGWLVLSPKTEINPDYFYYLLGSDVLYREFSKRAKGTTVKNLNIDLVKSVKVSLPPIAEQKRIAEILDKADAVRRKRQEAIRLTEELLRSTFLEMFGDPVTNPKGWDVLELGEILEKIESGWSPKCDSRPALSTEWGMLKLGAITWGHFNENENKALLPETSPKPHLEVKPGDLLFARKNTYDLVGATAFVHSTRKKLLLPDLIFRLQTNNKVNPVYLWQALSQKTTRFKLSKLASGSSGSMPNISKARLKTLRIGVPSMELQGKYAKFCKLFWKNQHNQDRTSDFIENLFNSLLQRAFRGEL